MIGLKAAPRFRHEQGVARAGPCSRYSTLYHKISRQTVHMCTGRSHSASSIVPLLTAPLPPPLRHRTTAAARRRTRVSSWQARPATSASSWCSRHRSLLPFFGLEFWRFFTCLARHRLLHSVAPPLFALALLTGYVSRLVVRATSACAAYKLILVRSFGQCGCHHRLCTGTWIQGTSVLSPATSVVVLQLPPPVAALPACSCR